MRTLIAFALLFAGARLLLAQDEGPDSQPPDQPAVEQTAPPDDGSGEDRAPGPTTMSMDDARVNVFTLIQSFIAERAIDGFWPLKNKGKGGGVLMLTLAATEVSHLRELGGGRFRAEVLLREKHSGKYYAAEFTTDLSGKEWKVLGMNLNPGKAPKPKKKSRVAARPQKRRAPPKEEEAAPADDGGATP